MGLLLSQPGHGIVVVEFSRFELWVSPLSFEGIFLHANHCVLGSILKDEERNETIAKLNGDSRQRQAALEEFYADELIAGSAPPLSEQQFKAALSVAAVQNDSVLATIIVSPVERA